jgi:hypothetical protein
MIAIARRRIMGANTIETLGYVSDGLIFMFDGIYNGGIGTHTNDPSKIKELVHGVELTNDPTYPLSMVCLDNGLYVDKNTTTMEKNAIFESEEYGDAVRNGAVTFEVCCLPSTEPISSYGTQEWGVNIAFGGMYYRRWMHRSVNLCVAINGKLYWVPSVDNRVDSFNKNMTVAKTYSQVSPSMNSGPSEQRIYTNGVVVNNKTYFWDGTKVVDNNIGVRAQPKSTSAHHTHPFVVYNIRMYNRGLTEAEVLANYAVDRERFGIG